MVTVRDILAKGRNIVEIHLRVSVVIQIESATIMFVCIGLLNALVRGKAVRHLKIVPVVIPVE